MMGEGGKPQILQDTKTWISKEIQHTVYVQFYDAFFSPNMLTSLKLADGLQLKTFIVATEEVVTMTVLSACIRT